jgi:hypothetical protein
MSLCAPESIGWHAGILPNEPILPARFITFLAVDYRNGWWRDWQTHSSCHRLQAFRSKNSPAKPRLESAPKKQMKTGSQIEILFSRRSLEPANSTLPTPSCDRLIENVLFCVANEERPGRTAIVATEDREAFQLALGRERQRALSGTLCLCPWLPRGLRAARSRQARLARGRRRRHLLKLVQAAW